MSKNTTKTFTVTDELGTFTFKRTEKGYCTMNGKRVSAKVFEQAERLYEEKLVAEIDANVEAAKETAAKASDHDLTAEEMEELFDLRVNKLWSWYELAQKYGITERRAREVYKSVLKADEGVEDQDVAVEVTAEVPEPVTGNTEEVYADEPVPVRPEFDIPGVNKDQASVGYRDGHEYVHDWFGKRYFRDGEEITKFEFEHEVHGAEERKETKPKPKGTRKSKDVAFELDGITLTAKQLDFLREVGEMSEDQLLGNVRSGVWCDILCDQIGGQFAGRPMSVGAMISTVCEKGLGVRHKERRDNGGRGKMVTVFRLTDDGVKVWEELGLN